MFSLICVWINGWVNNREAGDLRLDAKDAEYCGIDIYILRLLHEVTTGQLTAPTFDCWRLVLKKKSNFYEAEIHYQVNLTGIYAEH